MLAITGSMPPTCASSGVPSCPRMPMSMLRAERTGPIRAEVLALEHGGVAGDAALDGLLEDDVGLVEARLGTAGRVVVDLDRHGGPLRDGPTRRRLPGQGAGGRRRRRGRGGRLRLHGRLVGRGGRAGADEQSGQPGRRQHAPGARVPQPDASGIGFRHRWPSIVRGLSPRVVGCPVRPSTRPARAGRLQADAVPGGGPRAGGGPGVDVGPVAGRAAVRGGRTKAEAAVDVLHGAADHVGHAGNGRDDDVRRDGPGRPEQRHEAGRAAGQQPPPFPGAV